MNLDDTPHADNAGAAADGTTESKGHIGDILSRISSDVKTLAHDEVELVRDELVHSARTAVTEASIAMLGAIFALIGLAMLCVVVVVALAPVIPPLWARLLIMAGVYLVLGGAFAVGFGKKLATDAAPELGVPRYELKRTIAGVKEAIQS